MEMYRNKIHGICQFGRFRDATKDRFFFLLGRARAILGFSFNRVEVVNQIIFFTVPYRTERELESSEILMTARNANASTCIWY